MLSRVVSPPPPTTLSHLPRRGERTTYDPPPRPQPRWCGVELSLLLRCKPAPCHVRVIVLSVPVLEVMVSRVPVPCRPTNLIVNSVTMVTVVNIRVTTYLMHGQKLS